MMASVRGETVLTRLALLRLDLWLLLGVLPLLLPFVRRAGPPLMVIAGLYAFLLILLDREARGSARSSAWMATIALGAIFLAWASATLAWAPSVPRSSAAVVSAWMIYGAVVAIAMLAQHLIEHPALRALPFTIAAGAILVSLDLTLGGVGRRFLNLNAEPFRYNMVIVSLILLNCAALRMSPERRTSVALSNACVAIAALLGESEAAKLALGIAGVAYVATLVLSRRIVFAALAIALCGVWFGFAALAPIAAKLAALVPGFAAAGHAAERLLIWEAFSQLAIAGLPWGWGVESVASAPTLSFYAGAPDRIRAGLDWMHPHNHVIQVATELGAPGILFGLTATLVAAWWVQADAKLAAPRAALFAATVTIALVSHGLWQMWFWSAVGVSAVVLRSSKPT